MSHVGRNWQREREPWGRGVTGLIADRHTSLAGENAENLLFVPYNTILFDFDYWFWLERTLSEMNIVKDIAYSQVAVWPQKNNGSFLKVLFFLCRYSAYDHIQFRPNIKQLILPNIRFWPKVDYWFRPHIRLRPKVKFPHSVDLYVAVWALCG